ncbi:pilus assembly protein [Methylopila jiangsuensis]|uniref:Pilus assembly protein n=1 Tax=Methylopila jiangsuensis TaxID=586230 RepID=A0A9W6JJ66_9HYPH|nr:CpaD family pilus assembly protein [Methylopila jiangsuensis]MDR6285249.1 pilus assembly protein CpaD [Methylopila jiangsuensis]GLK77361.1 pilus assembly protein [Methylopila jiangsuensis]
MNGTLSLAVRGRLGAALIAATALTLGGCHADRIVGEPYPTSYEQRHPIALSEGAARLDLPVGAGRDGLTPRQKEDLRAFAAEWRRDGRSPIAIMTPQGGPSGAAASYSMAAVRSTLVGAGVPATAIRAQRYAADDREGPAPMRLGFVKLKAGLTHQCGLWPEDLGYGADFRGGAANEDYWNFGCAAQQNLAAQVADPEDLARPRAETGIYAARRQTVMEKHRISEITSARYKIEGASVSAVGGKSQ